MKSYYAIINATVMPKIEAVDYKDAVAQAIALVDAMNEPLDKVGDSVVSWSLEQVAED